LQISSVVNKFLIKVRFLSVRFFDNFKNSSLYSLILFKHLILKHLKLTSDFNIKSATINISPEKY